MLGSRMAVDCGVCEGRGEEPHQRAADLEICTACCGRGCVDAGQAYMPLLVLGRGGRRDLALEGAYLNDFHSLVCDTKIRSPLSSPPDQGYVAPGGGARVMPTATAPGAVVALPALPAATRHTRPSRRSCGPTRDSRPLVARTRSCW